MIRYTIYKCTVLYHTRFGVQLCTTGGGGRGPLLLKWGKARYEGVLDVAPGVTTFDELKAQVYVLTGVLPARQKLLAGKEAKHA